MAQSMTAEGHAVPAGLLDRERIVARAGFNRWLVPPAALAIHLCIGMAYGFSVFWLPLTRAIPGETPAMCGDMSVLSALFTTACNWRVSDLVVIYTLFFVVPGAAAATFGGWLSARARARRVSSPRSAGAAAC